MSLKTIMIIQFIGCGSMGSVLLECLIKTIKNHKFNTIDIYVTTKNNRSLPVQDTNVHMGINTNADIVFLCVKPQQFSDIDITWCKEESLVVSLLAGTLIETIALSTSSKNIVRVMPTLTMKTHSGITGWFSNDKIPNSLYTIVHKLFTDHGTITLLKEEQQFNAFTGCLGSGPGYVSYFLEGYIEYIIKELGCSNDEALSLGFSMMQGTCSSIATSGLTPKEFREKVTSPGGTTEAGINYLLEKKRKTLFQEALTSAASRSETLSNPRKTR